MDIQSLNCFIGGFSGPSKYYYIEAANNSVIAKKADSAFGKIVNLKKEGDINYWAKEKLEKFSTELQEIISQWEDKYIDNNIKDGTQWSLSITDYNGELKEFIGSNCFPNNWNLFIELLEKYFS